jgi:uncharacterized protein with GYD domain
MLRVHAHTPHNGHRAEGRTRLVVKMGRYDMVSRHEETDRQSMMGSSINFYMSNSDEEGI